MIIVLRLEPPNFGQEENVKNFVEFCQLHIYKNFSTLLATTTTSASIENFMTLP